MESVLISFAILQVLDVASTYLALKNPDIEEKNLFLLWLFSKIGVLPALVFSKVIILGVFGSAYYFFPSIRFGIAIGLGLVSILYLYVVFNNFRNGGFMR